MITPASDRAVLVSFGEAISDELHSRVRLFLRILRAQRGLFLVEAQPAYSSVLLTFDPRKIDLQTFTRAIEPLTARIEALRLQARPHARTVEIPVCYDPALAPDLADVATHAGLSAEDVIGLHAQARYTVSFFGFMPGFSYWTGLPEKLAIPRLATPRQKVPAGSVAIAAGQAGIYPRETPGGWRIIGRTPMIFFDPKRKPPCRLRLGDHIKVKPISLRKFQRLGGPC